MAAARLNIPTIFLPPGPMLSHFKKSEQRVLCDIKESIGVLKDDKITVEEFEAIAEDTCATAGVCGMMGMGNTMGCLIEALGMALTGTATTPAVYAAKRHQAKLTGERSVTLVKENITLAGQSFSYTFSMNSGNTATILMGGGYGSQG